MNELSKSAVLDSLSGRPTSHVPFMLLTWGWEYMWKCAGIPPWRRGSFDTWLDAYRATYERRMPDVIVIPSNTPESAVAAIREFSWDSIG